MLGMLMKSSLGCAAAFCFSLVLSPEAKAATPCESLKALKVPVASIQLPIGEVEVTGAEIIAPKDGAVASCLVTGSIAPVDPHAGTIHFKIALPDSWNGRALMLGGSGYDGFIPNVAAGPVQYPGDVATPLSRGYVVFGSDSGHQAK